MRYSILTFGCRVNQADSLRLAEELRGRGAQSVGPERADLVFVNTCAVTASAEQSARQAIRRIARLNADARIVVTGCYGTRAPDEVGALPSVIRVVSNESKDDLVPLLEAAGELTTADRWGGDGPCGVPVEPGTAGRTVYTLRVQTGCEERCSYCIIPRTRGRSRSLAVGDVLASARRAVAAGFKEIVLTGVHLGSYGRDLSPPGSLIGLLTALDSADLDALIRVSSLEPMDCTDDIVDLLATSVRIAPHFHLPLQHGSDRILSIMRRPYTTGYFRSLVDLVRRRLPHASIGSDLIAGFPGETERDFRETVEYLEGSPLSHLHVFPYSDRPDTEAASFQDKVPAAEIRERAAALRSIGERLTTRFRNTQIGTVRRGLTLQDGTLVLTDNFLKVRIPTGRQRNVWVRILVEAAGAELRGVPV